MACVATVCGARRRCRRGLERDMVIECWLGPGFVKTGNLGIKLKVKGGEVVELVEEAGRQSLAS